MSTAKKKADTDDKDKLFHQKKMDGYFRTLKKEAQTALTKLSKKHREFILTYFLNGENGRKAYIEIYPSVSPEAADVNASKLLKLPKVKHVQELIKAAAVAPVLEEVIADRNWKRKVLKEMVDYAVARERFDAQGNMLANDLPTGRAAIAELNKMDGDYVLEEKVAGVMEELVEHVRGGARSTQSMIESSEEKDITAKSVVVKEKKVTQERKKSLINEKNAGPAKKTKPWKKKK